MGPTSTNNMPFKVGGNFFEIFNQISRFTSGNLEINGNNISHNQRSQLNKRFKSILIAEVVNNPSPRAIVIGVSDIVAISLYFTANPCEQFITKGSLDHALYSEEFDGLLVLRRLTYEMKVYLITIIITDSEYTNPKTGKPYGPEFITIYA